MRGGFIARQHYTCCDVHPLDIFDMCQVRLVFLLMQPNIQGVRFSTNNMTGNEKTSPIETAAFFSWGGSQMISRKRTLMFQWSLRQRRSSCLGETIRGEIARTAVVRRISRQSIVHLSATAYGLPRSEDHPQSKGNNFRFATWLRVTYKWGILTCLAIWYMYVRFNHDLYSVLHKYAYPNRMSAVLHPRSSSFLLFWQRFSC